MMVLFLLRTVICTALVSLVLLDGDVLAESGYVIIASQHVSANTNESVCINLIDLNAQVTIQLKNTVHAAPLSQVTTDGMVRGQTCLNLEVPFIEPLTRLILRATVVGSTNTGESFSETRDTSVQLTIITTETYVQTDKPIYQAGQRVRIRILSLTYPSMKPYIEQYNEIYITSPDDIRVRQWRNMDTMEGLIDLSMQLSKDPVLGTWGIHVVLGRSETIQTFKIDEYVLPKFDVTITPPSYIFILDENVEFSVCGLYTYGQPVRGSIAVNASVDSRGTTFWLSVEDTGEDGCHVFDFQLTDLGGVNYIRNRRLRLDVQFIELVTGVERMETHDSTHITSLPLSLDVIGPSGFKPGLPYRFQILAKLPNGLPAKEESVLVTVRKSKGDGDFNFEGTYTTDQDGQVQVEFQPPFNPYITGLNIRVSYNHTDPLIMPIISITNVDAWYSPSGSFLAIRPLTSTYPVDENIAVELEFIIPESDADTILEFSYIVTANRNLITSGTRTWSHGTPGETSFISRHIDIGGRGDPSETGPVSKKLMTDPPNLDPYPTAMLASTSIPVHVTHNMAPSPTILVYFTRQDGEVVSARQEFNVKLAFENDVSLEFNSGQVYPGSNVLLNIYASPRSLCAIGSVDKSILLLEDSNRMTRQQVFSPMSRFTVEEQRLNQNCPITDRRHMSKRSSPGRLSLSRHHRHWHPRPRPRPQPGPSTTTNIRSWTDAQHLDSFSAFQNSGVQVLSNLVVEARPCYRYTETETRQVWYSSYYMRESFHFGGFAKHGIHGPVAKPNIAFDSSPIPVAHYDIGLPEREPSSGPIYQLRTHFPDTWLWHLSRISNDGVTTVSHSVPHSITDWVTTGFCTSSQHGIGIAEPISLRVFQPFFISATLPYSVIRDEVFPLKITVFNYLTQCFTVAVRIKPSSYFSIQSRDFFQYLCVCGGQAGSVEFNIIPRTLGWIPIIALGEYIPASQDLPSCGNTGNSIHELLDVWDAVNKTVLVGVCMRDS